MFNSEETAPVAEPEVSLSDTSDDEGDETEEVEELSDDGVAAVEPKSEPSSRNWLSNLPTLTPLQRNILKCSIAYFIGSLFTFSPYLSGFISDLTSYGPSDGERVPSPAGHMVATV